jgi:hypothetical protein
LIISNWILFSIPSLVIWFFWFIFKFSPHSLNYYLFYFESFSWMIFFFNSILRHRGVHGPVRFSFNLKIQPNWKIVFLINITQTEPRTGLDRTNFVRFRLVF